MKRITSPHPVEKAPLCSFERDNSCKVLTIVSLVKMSALGIDSRRPPAISASGRRVSARVGPDGVPAPTFNAHLPSRPLTRAAAARAAAGIAESVEISGLPQRASERPDAHAATSAASTAQAGPAVAAPASVHGLESPRTAHRPVAAAARPALRGVARPTVTSAASVSDAPPSIRPGTRAAPSGARAAPPGARVVPLSRPAVPTTRQHHGVRFHGPKPSAASMAASPALPASQPTSGRIMTTRAGPSGRPSIDSARGPLVCAAAAAAAASAMTIDLDASWADLRITAEMGRRPETALFVDEDCIETELGRRPETTVDADYIETRLDTPVADAGDAKSILAVSDDAALFACAAEATSRAVGCFAAEPIVLAGPLPGSEEPTIADGHGCASEPVLVRPLPRFEWTVGPPPVSLADHHRDAPAAASDSEVVRSSSSRLPLPADEWLRLPSSTAAPVDVSGQLPTNRRLLSSVVESAAQAIPAPVTPPAFLPYTFRPAGPGSLHVPKPAVKSAVSASGTAAAGCADRAAMDSDAGSICSAKLLHTIVSDDGISLCIAVTSDDEAALFARECDIRGSRLLVTRPLQPLPVWPSELLAGARNSDDVDSSPNTEGDSGAVRENASVVSGSGSTSSKRSSLLHASERPGIGIGTGIGAQLRRQSSMQSSSSVTSSPVRPSSSSSSPAKLPVVTPALPKRSAAATVTSSQSKPLPGFAPSCCGTEEVQVARWSVRAVAASDDDLAVARGSVVESAASGPPAVTAALASSTADEEIAAMPASASTSTSRDKPAPDAGGSARSTALRPTAAVGSRVPVSGPAARAPADAVTTRSQSRVLPGSLTGTAAPLAKPCPPTASSLPAVTGAGMRMSSRPRSAVHASAIGPQAASVSSSAIGTRGVSARSVSSESAPPATQTTGDTRFIVDLYFRLSRNSVPQGTLLAFVLGQQAAFRSPATSGGTTTATPASSRMSSSPSTTAGASTSGAARKSSPATPVVAAGSGLRSSSSSAGKLGSGGGVTVSPAAVGRLNRGESSDHHDDEESRCGEEEDIPSVYASDGLLSRAASVAVLPLTAASLGLRQTMSRGAAAPAWLTTVSRDRFLADAPGCPYIIV